MWVGLNPFTNVWTKLNCDASAWCAHHCQRVFSSIYYLEFGSLPLQVPHHPTHYGVPQVHIIDAFAVQVHVLVSSRTTLWLYPQPQPIVHHAAKSYESAFSIFMSINIQLFRWTSLQGQTRKLERETKKRTVEHEHAREPYSIKATIRILSQVTTTFQVAYGDLQVFNLTFTLIAMYRVNRELMSMVANWNRWATAWWEFKTMVNNRMQRKILQL